jgi:hypothetical protein
MVYKATARDVKDLQEWGEDNEVVSRLMKSGKQPRLEQIGYYSPKSANWSWQIGIARIGGKFYELLTRFGAVEGGREIYVPQYNMNLLREEQPV